MNGSADAAGKFVAVAPGVAAGVLSVRDIMRSSLSGKPPIDIIRRSAPDFQIRKASADDLINMMNKRSNVIAGYAEGDMVDYLIKNNANASHMKRLLDDGTMIHEIKFLRGVGRREVFHEWLHYHIQSGNGFNIPNEDAFINNFLGRHPKLTGE